MEETKENFKEPQSQPEKAGETLTPKETLKEKGKISSTPSPAPFVPPALPVQPPSSQIPPSPVKSKPVFPPIEEEKEIIEKEWVKKAEKIIEEEKEKPYEEEEKQENLQVEYLEKRFGKKLKKKE